MRLDTSLVVIAIWLAMGAMGLSAFDQAIQKDLRWGKVALVLLGPVSVMAAMMFSVAECFFEIGKLLFERKSPEVADEPEV